MKHFHCLGQLKRHRAPDARLLSPPLQREREREGRGRVSFHSASAPVDPGVSISPALRLGFTALSWSGDLSLGLRGRAAGGSCHFQGLLLQGDIEERKLYLSISLHLSPSPSISLYLSTLNLQTDPFLLLLPSSVSSFTVDQREAAERPAASSHVVWSLASRRARLCTAASCAWRRGIRGRGALATLTHYKGELCHFMSGFGTQKESV